jgi:hypothetical protein
MQLSSRTTGIVAVGASAAAAAHQSVLPFALLSAVLLVLTAGVYCRRSGQGSPLDDTPPRQC